MKPLASEVFIGCAYGEKNEKRQCLTNLHGVSEQTVFRVKSKSDYGQRALDDGDSDTHIKSAMRDWREQKICEEMKEVLAHDVKNEIKESPPGWNNETHQNHSMTMPVRKWM